MTEPKSHSMTSSPPEENFYAEKDFDFFSVREEVEKISH